jgi:hypothetical protein
MAVEINEGFLGLEVRGGDGHIAAELLRDVAVVHGGGGAAPIPDLGSSFLCVVPRWPERREELHDTGRHHRPGQRDPAPDDRSRHPRPSLITTGLRPRPRAWAGQAVMRFVPR